MKQEMQAQGRRHKANGKEREKSRIQEPEEAVGSKE
jgi:hypothetical protein